MLKKIIPALLAGSLFLTSHLALAQVNVNQFLNDYQENINTMLESYHDEVKEPLNAKIFDISQPLFYSFLKNSTHREYDEFLAMQFYENFKVNDQPTSFCFILYDAKNIKQLQTYLTRIFPTSEDAIFYLSAHELGHCFASHQRVLGKIEKLTTAEKEEQIADMFAIAFFLTRNQNEQALSILKEIKLLPKTDVHANGDILSKFYIEFKADAPKAKNMAQLFNITYEYFTKLQTNSNE